MPRLKTMPRMSQLGRTRSVRDMTALKGGTDLEFGVPDETLPEPMVLASPFGDASEQDQRINQILTRIGGDVEDIILAKQMINLLDTEIPHATTPEVLMYALLRRHNRQFLFQVPYRGGRRVRGGVVLDFLVESGGQWDAVQVHGDYWHSSADSMDRDDASRSLVLGQEVAGGTVARYVEAYESDLYADREGVMESVLLGRDYRRGY